MFRNNDDVRKLVIQVFEEPDMPLDLAGEIMWECTGWPAFFQNRNPYREIYYQLHHAKRALKRGFTPIQIYMGEDKIQPGASGSKFQPSASEGGSNG